MAIYHANNAMQPTRACTKMSLVGHRVLVDGGTYVGTVEREYYCTWGRRKGSVHSIQVSGMEVRWRRIYLPGILYWSKGRWRNKLWPEAEYTVTDTTTELTHDGE